MKYPIDTEELKKGLLNSSTDPDEGDIALAQAIALAINKAYYVGVTHGKKCANKDRVKKKQVLNLLFNLFIPLKVLKRYIRIEIYKPIKK